MARTALSRVAAFDLDYIPEPPVFTPLTAAILADADPEFAGMDSSLLNVFNTMASEPDEGSMMDTSLGALTFNPGDFQGSTYDPIASDYSNFVPGLEGSIAGNEAGLGINPSPGGTPPGPAPAPQPTGTGGTPPTNPCVLDYTNPTPCQFSAAQIATFGIVLRFGNLSQKCASYVETWNTTRVLGDPSAYAYSASVQSGDTSILKLSVQQQPPGTTPLWSNVVLTFTPVKLGHFEFIVRVNTTRPAAKQIFGCCITIVP